MDWRVKGVVQQVLSSLPGGVTINDWLQRTVGGLRGFESAVEGKVIRDWLVMVDTLAEVPRGVQGLDFLEVGTGWMPVLPVCFSLAGAASCTTIDISRHMSSALTFRMLALLEQYLPQIANASGRPLEQVEADYRRLRAATSVDDLLERANIRYLSPGDARATDLAPSSIDIAFSNNVFEHVPAEDLGKILRENFRVLRADGLALHSANCGDHYAYFDKNITFINYLAYTEREWRFWNSDLQYQNRLRPKDFVDIATQSGFDVKLLKTRTRDELRPVLAAMSLAPEFRHYDADQLCSTSVLIGGVKPASSTH